MPDAARRCNSHIQHSSGPKTVGKRSEERATSYKYIFFFPFLLQMQFRHWPSNYWETLQLRSVFTGLFSSSNQSWNLSETEQNESFLYFWYNQLWQISLRKTLCLGTENCDTIVFVLWIFQISPAYWKKYVLRVLFAVVRLLWPTISQSFMIQ